MGTAEFHIERYLEPEVRGRLWRQGYRTTLCRIEGQLIADLVLGRSADARFLLEHLFATPQRIIDLRYASDPGIRPATIEHAARNLAQWDVEREGRATALIMESDLGYGIGRMLQAHGAFSGSEFTHPGYIADTRPNISSTACGVKLAPVCPPSSTVFISG